MDSRETAERLRDEGLNLLQDLGWPKLFDSLFSTHAITGSLRYDLMVWRDMDIHMPVEPERRIEWAALLPALNAGLERAGCRLHKAQFLDDYVDPHPLGAGLYWGVEFVTPQGAPWKADIWGWAPDDFTMRQARDAQLIADLARADRDLILALKTEARAKPGYYGVITGSMDIYRFARASAGTSLDALETWKAAQSLSEAGSS